MARVWSYREAKCRGVSPFALCLSTSMPAPWKKEGEDLGARRGGSRLWGSYEAARVAR